LRNGFKRWKRSKNVTHLFEGIIDLPCLWVYMEKLKMISKWQSGYQKGVLLGAIGMALCSWTSVAGQKILFSQPTMPIGANAPSDPRKDIIKLKEPSLFDTPGAEIRPSASPSSSPSSRNTKLQPRDNGIFSDNNNKESDFLGMDSPKDSSLSSLKNTKDSSPLSRAWSASTTKDPWNDDSASKDRNSSDSLSGRKQNDRNNSRASSDPRNDRSAELANSYTAASKYGGSGLSQLMERLGDSRGDRDDQANQLEMSLMFKNMRSSTSPMGGQDVSRSVHESMWNQLSKPSGNPNFPQSDSFSSSSKKDRTPAFGTGSFSSLYSPQPPVTGPGNAPGQSLLGDRPSAPAPKPQQPAILPMPKRPGQPF
jgi:hypothetical protein